MKRVGIVLSLLVFNASLSHADFNTGMNAYNNGDFKTAISNWEDAGSLGDVNAQFNLAALYEKGGEGLPKDLSLAFAWYRVAAAQNVAAATQSIERLMPLLTSRQIEEGNRKAISILGRWYRDTIGLSEADYKKIVEDRAKREKAKQAAEQRAASERARRQRALIAKRDAEAKRAKRVDEKSRRDAIRAAQAQAEEAKRKAEEAKRQREEEERLALLRAQEQQELKKEDALKRLQELKAKQSGEPGRAVLVESKPTPAPQAPVKTQPIVQPVQPQPKTVAATTPSASPATPATATKSTAKVVAKVEPKVQPTSSPVTMPVVVKGMDKGVVAQIFEAAKSQPLDTAQAKAEISSGRTDIEALKWSLISAARGKSSAQRMNSILTKSMSPVQVAEANRLAAEWIAKRQSRQ